MASPDSVDAALPKSSQEENKERRGNLAYILELLVVCDLALLLFGAQVFVLGPKMSLLFDSQGFLFITQACNKAFALENLREIAQYFTGFCHDEVLRTAIVSHMPGTLELVKSGPLLPGILLLSYAVTGKLPVMQHWNIGAGAMLILMSIGVGGIWIWARALGGVAAGRIAAVLSILYAGFSVNAGRILTEIPATTVSVFALMSVFFFAKIARDKGSLLNKSVLSIALGCGILTGLLMLGRPTLLPWPLLMGFCLFIYSQVGKIKIFHPATILSFVVGCSICLIPWAMTKQVLTGSPSIVIERYGPLNLSAGMNLRTDGFDALPSPLVAHPDRFNQTTGEVLHQLLKQFQERPAAVLHLLLRKPARLIDSPWNDFQVKEYGIPILVQRFEHQFILLAAVLGIVLLLEHGRKRPDYLLLLAGLMIGVFMCFHLVACLFISMTRYFITAMPVAIVAASYFLAHLLRKGKSGIQSFLGVVLAPLVSMLLYYALVPGYGRISDLSSDLGLAQLSLSAAFVMTGAFAAGVLLPAFTIFKGARSKLLLGTFTLISGLCCFISVCYLFMCSEAVLRLGSVDHEKMVARTTIPPGTNCKRWYLVLDANDASVHGMPQHYRGILSDVHVSLNGRELNPAWLPLFSADTSMREESMYLAVFAYSCGKRCIDLRQWICAELPPETIVSPGANEIVFSLAKKKSSHPKIFADFTDPLSKRIHTVSMREFSWTKGFFADCPGEMRIDEWTDGDESSLDVVNLCGQTCRLKPRAFLLGVESNSHIETWLRTVNVPDQKIESRVKPMSSFVLSSIPGLAESASNIGQALRIKVSGQLRSPGKPTTASVCLLEGFRQGNSQFQEYAPLSPETLIASSDWRDFSFEDVVIPFRRTAAYNVPLAQAQTLQSLNLQFFGRPWWEVLDYGLFKGKGSVEFRNISIEIKGGPALDLSQEPFHTFELDSQFKTP